MVGKLILIPIILMFSLLFLPIVNSIIATGGLANNDLHAQDCNQQNSDPEDTFDLACDTSYPGICGGATNAVGCDDAISETFQSSAVTNFGGINITVFNTSIINCASIDTVLLCNQWWSSSVNIQNCSLKVDADGGSSFTTVNTTCPSTTPPDDITCQDVTSFESWQCSNFFGSSGIRSKAIVQAQASTAGIKTLTTDVYYFNVSYVLNDTTPPTITLIQPANNTATNEIPLNITFTVTDDDSIDQICSLLNSTFTFDTGTFTQATNSNLTLAEGSIILDQEFPNLELTCFDNSVNNNSQTLNLNYTLDTNPPILSPFTPDDNERFNNQVVSSIQISANCTDLPVFNLNITVSNTTDTVATFADNSPENNVLSIDENLDISALGLGNYTVNYTCADTHTSKAIGDYNVRKNTSSYEIKWVATDLNQFRIKYLQNSLAMDSFGSVKQPSDDRYNFFFNANETETKTTRTFIFEITSNSEVYYLPNSKYRGHLITGNNWIDFELDDPDATYLATKNADGNWEVEVTTVRTELNFKSIGELNIATVSRQFELFSIVQVENLFQVTQCRTDTGSVLLLALFFLIAFGLIGTALSTNIGFIGVFGAIMLWVTSWFISACIAILATLLTFLSILFFFYFIFRGFFPSVFEKR